ncbi:hypothetical protein P4U97_12315 [Bacillus swezeyi]|nr:hypothetical protein [Bacillus swezeyi]
MKLSFCLFWYASQRAAAFMDYTERYDIDFMDFTMHMENVD